MSDLWGVLLGGGLAIASSVGVKLWDGMKEARALRGALRAEIAATLEISERRGHLPKATALLQALDAGIDVPYSGYGASDTQSSRIFDGNAEKIGLIGRELAHDVTAYYTRLQAALITMKAFEAGILNDWTVSQRAEQVRETMSIWLEAKRIGDDLIKRL